MPEVQDRAVGKVLPSEGTVKNLFPASPLTSGALLVIFGAFGLLIRRSTRDIVCVSVPVFEVGPTQMTSF